jgi:rod shape-determining protein MreD
MGTVLKWIAGISLCLVLQTTLMRVVAIAGITPDLLMIALFLLGIRFGAGPALFAGFFIGLGQDLYTPSILGQTALAKTVTGFFIGLFNERVMRTDPVMKIILLLACFALHDSMFTVVTIVKTHASAALFFSELFTRTLPRAAYTIAVGSLVYLYDYFVKPTLRR